VASYVWFTTGAVLLIAFFPQQIAAPCIIGAAIGDPLLGMTRKFRRRYTFSITYIALLAVFIIFQYRLELAVLAAGIMMVSESLEIRVKWQLRPTLFYSRSKKKVSHYRNFFEVLFKTDDDFMMQIVPAVALAVIFLLIGWNHLPPELIQESSEIARILG
jgi:hypothetical protein